MDLTGLKEKIRSLAGKYKYVALIMMVGLVLMLVPSGKDHQPAEQSTEPAEIAQTDEERLEQILMQKQSKQRFWMFTTGITLQNP
jgi:hypothetical protein